MVVQALRSTPREAKIEHRFFIRNFQRAFAITCTFKLVKHEIMERLNPLTKPERCPHTLTCVMSCVRAVQHAFLVYFPCDVRSIGGEITLTWTVLIDDVMTDTGKEEFGVIGQLPIERHDTAWAESAAVDHREDSLLPFANGSYTEALKVTGAELEKELSELSQRGEMFLLCESGTGMVLSSCKDNVGRHRKNHRTNKTYGVKCQVLRKRQFHMKTWVEKM